jgi:hypothetical protein
MKSPERNDSMSQNRLGIRCLQDWTAKLGWKAGFCLGEEKAKRLLLSQR